MHEVFEAIKVRQQLEAQPLISDGRLVAIGNGSPIVAIGGQRVTARLGRGVDYKIGDACILVRPTPAHTWVIVCCYAG